MIENLGQSLKWGTASIASFPELHEKELHFWWLPLQLNEEQSTVALTLLSDLQRDKYNRRATPELKQHYLAGRYYLLNLLAAYSKQSPSEISLTYSRLKKPSLSDRSLGLEFNFTDTLGYGVFAFSKHRQLGVDIESRHRKSQFKAIAERRFTKQELDFVTQDGEFNSQRCISIWTRKEAYGKAIGVGINFQMNQRNLYATGTPETPYEYTFEDEENRQWRCLQFQLGDKFISSVVHEGHQTLNVRAFSSLEETSTSPC